MSNATRTQIGAINQTGDDRALMLKVFAGEVITAFEQATTFLDKTYVRTITHGKSAQFPVMGRMPEAVYHTPGTELTGQTANHAEKVITIDQLLLSHVFIADIDEALNHYEVRSKYTTEMGRALAKTYDRNVGMEIAQAARSAAAITGGDSGLVITNADLISSTPATKFAAWLAAITQAAADFDNKDIPGTRYLAVSPVDYYFLMTQMDANGFSLLKQTIGGVGSIAQGTMPEILGFKIVSAPHLPLIDNTSATYHAYDLSKTRALAWTEDVVGTVKLMDLSLQSQWDIRRQGTLMVARYAMGHGVLRPECAVEFKTA